MKEFIYYILGQFIIFSGIIKIVQKKHSQKNGIHAIYSHNPSHKLFEHIIKWQKNQGYTFLSAYQVLEMVKGEKPIPAKVVWWSFDDGWLDNINNILPIAEKYQVPITIFICTEAIEKQFYWWVKIQQYRHLLPPAYRDLNVIKTLSENDRQQMIEQLDKQIDKHQLKKEVISLKELQNLAKNPLVSIGGHTHRHPIMPNCTLEQLDDEIKISTEKLQEWLGTPMKMFAYPNGSFDGREMEILKKYGYEMAFTTQRKIVVPDTQNHYYLPRFGITDTGSMVKNIAFMFGIMQFFIKPIERFITTTKKYILPH